MTKMIRKYLTYIGFTLIVFVVAFTAKGNEVLVLEPENTVVLRGAIDSVVASDISYKLLMANQSTSDIIYLVLDSPGGSISAGNQIIDVINSLTKPVTCISMFAASMAHAILQNCNTRYTTPTGVSMIHRAKGGFYGQFNDGEVESKLNFWRSVVQKMEIRNAERMGLKLDEYKKLAANEFWCEGEDCVKTNFVDNIVSLRCSVELLQSEYTHYSRRSSGTVSACPLIRNYLRK
jgi:ATP-dependent Clp protease protease subunit